MNNQRKMDAVYLCALLACVGIIFVLLKERAAPYPPRLDDDPCPKPGTGAFLFDDVPSTALVSFPGSGNTWTRYLLTTASGVLTGTVYHKRDVIVSHEQPNMSKRVLVVKTHKQPEDTRHEFPYDRCLLLIRNPYEALLSEFNREHVKKPFPYNHRAFLPSTGFGGGWLGFVSRRMRGWSRLYRLWLADCKPSSRLHVLVYSRMMNNLEHELHEVFRFLNISITPMVHCAVRHREGTTRRAEHAWQKKVAVFSQEQTRVLNAEIDGLQRALENATGQSFQDLQDWKR